LSSESSNTEQPITLAGDGERFTFTKTSLAMHFTIRQLLLYIVWFAFVFAIMRFTDGFYAALVGVPAGMALFFLDRLIGSWKHRQSHEIQFFLIAIAACLVATAIGVGNIVTASRTFAMESNELRTQIRQNPRFQHVDATYSGVVDRRVLTVSGCVASRTDEEALRKIAAEQLWGFKTTIRWRIKIVKEEPLAD
jgi:hypothetical protein